MEAAGLTGFGLTGFGLTGVSLTEVNWAAPWLAPFAELGSNVSAGGCDALNSAARAGGLRNRSGRDITFVGADAAGAEPYESFIARTGQVPTRACLHDAFNALAWLHFPCSKARLNQLQAAQIARDGVQGRRGLLRDALTLIDENAVLLITRRTDVVDALRAHDWMRAFQRERAAWSSDLSVVVFGHALLEKLVRPYKAITAHAVHVELAHDASLQDVDRCLAAALVEQLAPQAMIALPVLGIPGWCADNAHAAFYADRAVFRPAKMRRPSTMEMDRDETRRA